MLASPLSASPPFQLVKIIIACMHHVTYTMIMLLTHLCNDGVTKLLICVTICANNGNVTEPQYLYTHAHVCVYMHVYICVYTHACYNSLYIYAHIHVYASLPIYIYMYIVIYMYIYTCIHAYTYIYDGALPRAPPTRAPPVRRRFYYMCVYCMYGICVYIYIYIYIYINRERGRE